MARVLVQEAPFDVAAELAGLTAGRTDIGGIGLFLGTVRDSAGGRRIAAMTLEHYPAMTGRALAAIAAEAEARWPLAGCTVIHRVGRLAPGEGIVLVATASAHRQAALEATAFLIDWLKTKAPFWKHEEFADGGGAWVDAREEDDEAAARWAVAGDDRQDERPVGPPSLVAP
jgi:molybdopterin synthase catalytic subunit